jgi:hypothetical protein
MYFIGPSAGPTQRYHFSFGQDFANGVTLYANNSFIGQTTAVPLNTNAIIGFTVASSGININVNSTLTNYTGAASVSANNSTQFIFGDARGVFVSDVNIYEFVGYSSALTTAQRQQVEGYLAQKWGLQTSLPSNHPYRYSAYFTNQPYVSTILSPNITNRINNALFLPTSIPGCQLWFDATDTTSIFSDTAGTTRIRPGGSVARWNDKSGNNNYLQQATAGNRPVYQKTPGGYDAVYFSMNGIQLTTINNNPLTGNSARTIFLIQQAPQAGSITRVSIGAHNGSSPPNTFGIDNNTPISVLYCPYVYTAADNTIGVSLRTLAEIWTYYDPSVSQVGGNYNFLNAQTKSTTLNTSATPWYFGLRPDNVGSIDSYTCEFIMYNTFLTTLQRNQIEGYLAWKWGLVASLPISHPYKTAPFSPLSAIVSVASLLNTSQLNSKLITSYFNPRSISGLQFWIDGADRTSMTFASANTISAWNDKSGNGFNLSQSTTAYQPIYSSNYVNLGTASNYYMNMPQAAINNASSWSMFFVFNPINSTNWIMAKQFDGNNTLNLLSLTYNGFRSSGTTNVLYFKAQNAATLFTGPAALTTNSVQLISMRYDGTNMQYYLNGNLASTTAGSFTIINETGASSCALGAFIVAGALENPGTTNFNLGEFQFFNNALTTAQRQTVEGYLAWKWGIQASLPSSQPFKNFPPPP